MANPVRRDNFTLTLFPTDTTILEATFPERCEVRVDLSAERALAAPMNTLARFICRYGDGDFEHVFEADLGGHTVFSVQCRNLLVSAYYLPEDLAPTHIAGPFTAPVLNIRASACRSYGISPRLLPHTSQAREYNNPGAATMVPVGAKLVEAVPYSVNPPIGRSAPAETYLAILDDTLTFPNGASIPFEDLLREPQNVPVRPLARGLGSTANYGIACSDGTDTNMFRIRFWLEV